MTKETDEALDAFENTGSPAAIQYLVGVVADASFGKPEGLFMSENLEGRLNKIYEERQGNVPPAIEGLRAAIDASKGSYKFTFKVKNLP